MSYLIYSYNIETMKGKHLLLMLLLCIYGNLVAQSDCQPAELNSGQFFQGNACRAYFLADAGTIGNQSEFQYAIGYDDPLSAQEFYNFLSGRWKDGSLMRASGDGYDEDMSVPITRYAFSDFPGQAAGWNALSAELLQSDPRLVAAINKPQLLPGEILSIDVAHTYHREPGLNHVSNAAATTLTFEPVSVNEPAWAESLKIFPNPVGEVLNISAPGANLSSFIILDALGREVLKSSYALPIGTATLPGGTYFIRLIHEEGSTVTRKFVKF